MAKRKSKKSAAELYGELEEQSLGNMIETVKEVNSAPDSLAWEDLCTEAASIVPTTNGDNSIFPVKQIQDRIKELEETGAEDVTNQPIITGTAGEMTPVRETIKIQDGLNVIDNDGIITVTTTGGEFITIDADTFTGSATTGFVQDDNTYQKAIDRVKEELKNDPEMYFAFQSNIAMPFVDVYHRVRKSKGSQLTHQDIYEIANEAAKQFLDLLIK